MASVQPAAHKNSDSTREHAVFAAAHAPGYKTETSGDPPETATRETQGYLHPASP